MENDPLLGKELGAYSIQSKLGEGGMARVYKAYHARLRREVAIKVILSQIAEQSGFKLRFEREAQLVANLQHPNIVAIYDFGELGNLTYLVMQYVGGGTLRDQLRGGHALDLRRAIQYAQQMARALHHAHQRGIVHRDVKPQNMLISASDPNQLLLSDFGIAKLFNSEHEPTLPNLAPGSMGSDPTLTNVNQIVGTAEYMSPEQINGKPVDARTDVYALGVVLFQMLSGDVPFHSTTIQGLLFQHVYTPPRPLREVNPYVPPVLEQIVLKAMAKAPEDRFQSAEEMARALEVANAHVTYPLSAPLSGGYPSPGTYPATPSSPLSPQNLSTIGPGAAPNSYYGQASKPGVPVPSADSNPPQSFYGTQPPLQGSAQLAKPDTRGGNLVTPSLQRSMGMPWVRYSGVALVLLLLAGLILARAGLFPSTTNPTPSTRAFSEDFHNNDRNWTIGSQDNGNFTAALASSQYMLTVGNARNTYFPHPDTSAVGTLPANFTLTAQLAQTGGTDNSVFYGLAFHLTENGSKVYCYALVINMFGNYQLLKYNADIPNTPTTLWMGQLSPFVSGINHPHTLQAKVQGSSFSFSIDGKQLAVGANGATTYTDNDNPYTGGIPAVMVTGPNTSFTVSSVALAIP